MRDAPPEVAEKASKYDWTGAAEVCAQLLDRVRPEIDPSRTAELSGLLARSYFNAAFQSTSRNEFNRLMELSRKGHEHASSFYQKLGLVALSDRETARALHSSFWLKDTADDKRKLMVECISLAQRSARALETQGNRQTIVEALLDLLVFREKALLLATNRKELLDLFETAVETAWRIIDEFQEIMERQIVLESIDVLVHLYIRSEFILEPPRYEELERKLAKLKDRIPLISADIGTLGAKALASEASGLLAADLEGDVRKALGLYEGGISIAQEIRDYYLTGRLETSTAGSVRYLAISEEYAEKRREELERAMQIASSAIKNLTPSSPGAWLKSAYGRYVDASTLFATAGETDPDRKRAKLRETIEMAKRGMMFENHSFLPTIRHALAKTMYFLATMDVGPEEKARLLSEALPIREETVKALELLSPQSFERGVMLNYLALLKAELSKVENNRSVKRALLDGAASDMQRCVELCATLAGIHDPPPLGRIRVQAQYNEAHGDILRQLFGETLDSSTARKAIAAYEQTISYLSKSQSFSPIPVVRWKIARTYDSIREYQAATESFHEATAEYRLAGKKLPKLASAFEEFAQYMEAWAFIEGAKLKHDQEQYTLAAEDYTNASEKLMGSKAWSHLSRHYSACSSLELGEARSREERPHAAIESFNAARTGFQEAKNYLESKSPTVNLPQEKTELGTWIDITSGRLGYAVGRTQLEEAKISDARGDEEASSAQYRAAAESFGRLLSENQPEQTHRDLEALKLTCDAWAKMKAAEAKASPELYAEAAESFAKVERIAIGKRSQLAALANASMCKALESGSLFRRTRNKQLYAEIKSRLETAADFYEEAGIKKAADWTRATQRFFDALTFLAEAEVEADPKKKTGFYDLAEKHLNMAAQLYGEAGYFKKKEEALNHLRRARGEKMLLLTPIDALDKNPVPSESITPVSFTRDQPGGLERLETANIVGNLTLDKNVVGVNSDFVLEIEMANVGKTAATLLKIENVGQEGLEVAVDKTDQKIEDGYIDMRGRRLDYLKTYEVKIPIKAARKGAYNLHPRVLYVDEKGEYRSYEFGATRMLVTEAIDRSLLESERRLSAIMFTDLVGYTSLTEENEPVALALLEEHRKMLRPLFPKYNGREIKTVGDMFLVEFASALEAVRCAIQMQQALSRRNIEKPETKKILLRIGVHVGDVEHSQGDVYGDAVNVASRIEPLAEPGGIVVTRQVYDQIRNRADIKAKSLGDRQLKNVKDSIEIFSVST